MEMTERLVAARVHNVGASCTTAAAVTALEALGATGLPPLDEATRAISGREQSHLPPRLLDYVAIPLLRRAPIDVRIEAMAAAAGVRVTSRTRICLIPFRLGAARAGDVLLAHLAWGQEAPGVRGAWGVHPLRPATWQTGGHSVVVAAVRGRAWDVVDSNHDGLQRWARPGWAVTATRIRVIN